MSLIENFKDYIKPYERLDDLELDGAYFIQNPELYGFTSDAVLLANVVKIKNNDLVCDFGTGSGIIAVLIALKTKARHIDGIEIQPTLADIAKRNVIINNLNDKVNIAEGDIKNAADCFEREKYDVVVCNPPYKRTGSGEKNISETIAVCRHEIKVTLNDIINSAAKILKFSGRLALISKTERLAEIIYKMHEYNIEAKTVTLVKPKASKSPDTVIVEGTKGGKSGLKIYELIVYNEDGSMTDEAKKLYNKA